MLIKVCQLQLVLKAQSDLEGKTEEMIRILLRDRRVLRQANWKE